MFPLLVLVLSPPCATRTYGHTNKPSANISGLGILFCGLCGNSTQPLGEGGPHHFHTCGRAFFFYYFNDYRWNNRNFW